MALNQTQIEQLNAAALKPNKTAEDIANLEYAAKTFGYQPPNVAPVEETQESVDSLYAEAASRNPAINALMQGGSSIEEITYGLSSGDLTGIVDWNGQPFSVADQQEALTKAGEANKLYYEALQQKETAEAEATLAQEQADFQDYLISSGQAFETDKAKADIEAAKSGVLFSGSRVQKEKNLARAYGQGEAYARGKVGRGIGKTAQDFQYKYGGEAAKGLSKYYQLGSNVYNPNVARGGATPSSLSSVYQPGDYDYQGTRKTERSAAAQTRAAGLLYGKGNKLLRTGYKNQY